MSKLLRMLRWEIDLQVRHHIVTANVLSTGFLAAFVSILPIPLHPKFASLFIFLDPALIGLSFVGAIVLMEKAARVHLALGVTPSPPWVYVASKILTLSLGGIFSGLVVAWVAYRGQFDWPMMLIALTLSNIVAVLIGFAIVARSRSMNDLMVKLIYVSTALFIPILAHFEIIPAAPLAWIPSFAMLVMLDAAGNGAGAFSTSWLLAAGYLCLWIAGGAIWAMREYKQSIITEGR